MRNSLEMLVHVAICTAIMWAVIGCVLLFFAQI